MDCPEYELGIQETFPWSLRLRPACRCGNVFGAENWARRTVSRIPCSVQFFGLGSTRWLISIRFGVAHIVRDAWGYRLQERRSRLLLEFQGFNVSRFLCSENPFSCSLRIVRGVVSLKAANDGRIDSEWPIIDGFFLEASKNAVRRTGSLMPSSKSCLFWCAILLSV